MYLGKKQLTLLIMSVTIVVASIGMYLLVKDVNKEKMISVVIAKEDILPEDDILEHVVLEKRPEKYVPQNAVKTLDNLKNMNSKVTIEEGSYIFERMYKDMSEFPKNSLAISLEDYADFLLTDLIPNKEYLAIFSSEGMFHNKIKFRYLYSKTSNLDKVNPKNRNMIANYSVISFDTLEEAEEFSININKYKIKTIAVSDEELNKYEYHRVLRETPIAESESEKNNAEQVEKIEENLTNEESAVNVENDTEAVVEIGPENEGE